MCYTDIMKRIILASSSPRRIEMMKNNGFEPEIMPADVAETPPMDMTPEGFAMFLALKKALYAKDAVNGNADADGAVNTPDDGSAHAPYDGSAHAPDDGSDADCLIIAADTIVVHGEKIIGKPKNQVDAFLTLKRLRDDCHQVITGVCIIDTADNAKTCFYETTDVYFTDYSDDELNDYINTDEPYDKAGGYAIQGTFKKYIDHIEGDFDNVVGFPWSKIQPYLDACKRAR